MDYTIEYGEAAPEMTITLAGRATPADFHRLVRALQADPHTRPGMTILIDISNLDVSGFRDAEMREAVEPVAEYDWLRPARGVALVAASDEQLAAATLWRAYLGGSTSNREVFRSRESAHAWLTERHQAL